MLHRAKLKTQDPSGVQKAERPRDMASAALSRRGNAARGLSPSLVNTLKSIRWSTMLLLACSE